MLHKPAGATPFRRLLVSDWSGFQVVSWIVRRYERRARFAAAGSVSMPSPHHRGGPSRPEATIATTDIEYMGREEHPGRVGRRSPGPAVESKNVDTLADSNCLFATLGTCLGGRRVVVSILPRRAPVGVGMFHSGQQRTAVIRASPPQDLSPAERQGADIGGTARHRRSCAIGADQHVPVNHAYSIPFSCNGIKRV